MRFYASLFFRWRKKGKKVSRRRFDHVFMIISSKLREKSVIVIDVAEKSWEICNRFTLKIYRYAICFNKFFPLFSDVNEIFNRTKMNFEG